MIELEYENQINDVLQFHRFYYKNSPYQQRFNLLIKILFPVFWIYFEFTKDFSTTTISKILSTAIVILITWVVFPRFQKFFFDFQVMQHHKKGKYNFFLTKHKLIINETNFYDITAAQEMEFQWKNVLKLRDDSNSFYIFFNRRTALIIPKKYFSSKEMISDFEKEVNENIRNSREVKNA